MSPIRPRYACSNTDKSTVQFIAPCELFLRKRNGGWEPNIRVSTVLADIPHGNLNVRAVGELEAQQLPVEVVLLNMTTLTPRRLR